MALSRWDRADLVIHSDFLGDIQKLSNGLSNRPLLRQVQLTTLDRQDRGLLTGVTCNDSVDALTKEAALIPTLPTKTFCFVVTMRSEWANRDETRGALDLISNFISHSRYLTNSIR